MTDLLIHSMAEARAIVEIGAEFGGMSTWLARHAQAVGGSLTSIDPAPKPEFVAWSRTSGHVRHIARPSLEAMGGLAGIDAWLIDGDHNHYTVSNELKIVDRLARRDGKPLLVFLHDVCWPCARRDIYYAPDRIPPAHRHAHSWDLGVMLDRTDLVPGRGFGDGRHAFALHSGGERNVVLTAIEDFLADVRAEGRDVAFAMVPAVFGLGVIFASDAPWLGKVADVLLPVHDNPLLATFEENRLRNYPAVIDWQDPTAAEQPRAA